MKHLLSLSLMLLSFSGFAQTVEMKSRLTDAVTGKALVNATIRILGNATTTVSDNNGDFAFTIPTVLLADTAAIAAEGYPTTWMPVRYIDGTTIRLAPMKYSLNNDTLAPVTGITGKVVDAITGNGLMNMAIKVLHHAHGYYFTNKAGEFKINVSENEPIDSLLIFDYDYPIAIVNAKKMKEPVVRMSKMITVIRGDTIRQSKRVMEMKGKVIDYNTHRQLANVNISTSHKLEWAYTNANGDFSFPISLQNISDTATIATIGYQTQRIAVLRLSNATVKLVTQNKLTTEPTDGGSTDTITVTYFEPDNMGAMNSSASRDIFVQPNVELLKTNDDAKLVGSGNTSSEEIRGRLLDASTGDAVPYAIVKLMNYQAFAASDKKGNFRLRVPQNARYDSLVISNIGYKTLHYGIQHASMGSIKLMPNVYALPAVQVTSRKGKVLVINSLGRYRVRLVKYYYREFVGDHQYFLRSYSYLTTINPNPQTHIVARYFRYEPEYNPYSFIKEISFKIEPYFENFIKPFKADLKDSLLNLFRIRIFAPGKDGAPGDDLLREDVFVTDIYKSNLITINLEKYRLRFPRTGLMAGIEIIKCVYPIGFPSKTVTPNNVWVYAYGKWKQEMDNGKHDFVSTQHPLDTKHTINLLGARQGYFDAVTGSFLDLPISIVLGK